MSMHSAINVKNKAEHVKVKIKIFKGKRYILVIDMLKHCW